jgi:hypothetical protein
MALFVLIILSLLGFVLITSSIRKAAWLSMLWSEGAFSAAEGGLHTGIDQLSANPTTDTGGAGNDDWRFIQLSGGRKTDAAAQPFHFVRTQREPVTPRKWNWI